MCTCSVCLQIVSLHIKHTFCSFYPQIWCVHLTPLVLRQIMFWQLLYHKTQSKHSPVCRHILTCFSVEEITWMYFKKHLVLCCSPMWNRYVWVCMRVHICKSDTAWFYCFDFYLCSLQGPRSITIHIAAFGGLDSKTKGALQTHNCLINVDNADICIVYMKRKDQARENWSLSRGVSLKASWVQQFGPIISDIICHWPARQELQMKMSLCIWHISMMDPSN